jgi:PAS domain S-box-containing protein
MPARLPRVAAPSVSLRSALFAVLVGALAYVAVVGLVLIVRIGPATSRLQRESRGVVDEYRDSHRRVTELERIHQQIGRLLDSARKNPVSVAVLESHRLRLQQMEESAHTLERLSVSAGPPSALQTLLTGGVQQEATLRLALLGAIAALELNDLEGAGRLLRHASSLAGPVRAVLGEATAIALNEVSRQQELLAGAASTAASIVSFWFLAGVVGAPLLVLFLRRRLYLPLSQLDDGLARIAGGDLDVALSAPVNDELGRVAEHFNRMTEVLRQRAMEEEERTALASAARTRAILEAALDAVVVIDGEGLIREWSRQAGSVFGWPRDEVLGRPLAEVIGLDELRDEHRRSALQYGHDGPTPMVGRRVETSAQRRDGTRIPVEVALTPLSRTGEFSAFIRDLTEHRRLEADLRQSQKMDAVGRLAGGIAHDFNNLLTGIIGYSDLLTRDQSASDQVREDASAILSAALRGADLARKMLTLARRSHGRDEPVDPDRVVQQVTDLVARTMDRRIELALELNVHAPVVRGDASELVNAVLNLALNARDAMPTGGRLGISTRIVRLDAAFCARQSDLLSPGEHVQLVVSDSGTGMSEETRSRLFEPFFSTKPSGEGTGLGLAMVYGTVRSHRGIIEVDTGLGKGTTFTIYLPVDRTVRAGDAEPARDVRTGHGRILLVDDEDAVRIAVARMLRKLGYEVDTASDGLEAVGLVRESSERWDLIILDGNMPRMTGHDAARHIREIRPELPLLLATGYFDATSETSAALQVFNGAVPKPFDLATLSRAVAGQMTRK